jgi:hypothetical protein
MKRTVWAAAIAALACVCALHAQSAAQTRRILFDSFVPIASRILPGDRRITVVSAKPLPAVVHIPPEDVVARLVQKNPTIFMGRIVEKQPVFLRLVAGQKSTEVSSAEAIWIGSRVTVLIERIIHTTDELPLTLLQRLTFIEEGDGSATVNGVRIDTETPWLEPIQQGRRYLIAGRIVDGAFSSAGMWMEPPEGGKMRSRLRDPSARVGQASRVPKTPFDDWRIEDATDSLELEVQRRRPAR